MTVAEAGQTDAEAVVALWSSSGLTRLWNDPRADFDRAIAGPGSTVLVHREGGAILATVMVGHDGHRGWVYDLATDPARRRTGLGRGMMAAAEDSLRARRIPKLQLMVREGNDAALAFYAALGLERQPVVTLGRFLETED